MRRVQPVPHVVDADADGDKRRLAGHDVLFKSRGQVFRLLAADADVNHCRDFQVGIFGGEHGVDVAQITAALRNGIADGDNGVARFELKSFW